MDVQEIQTFYQEHVRSIYRYVYSKVGNREDAEDLTSEIFLNAVRPVANTKHVAMTPYTLRQALLKLGFNCIVSDKYAKGIGNHAVHLKFSQVDNTAAAEAFARVMKAWFPHHEELGPGKGVIYVRLDQSRPQLEARGEWHG